MKDAWFTFDTVLVILMVLEYGVMPILLPLIQSGSSAPPTAFLRLLRLLRLTRLVRLLGSVPELVTIIKGMRAALRAVISTFVLIVILVYVFGILLSLLLKDDDETQQYF